MSLQPLQGELADEVAMTACVHGASVSLKSCFQKDRLGSHWVNTPAFWGSMCSSATYTYSSILEGRGRPEGMFQRQHRPMFWRTSKITATSIKSKLISCRGFGVDASSWGWRIRKVDVWAKWSLSVATSARNTPCLSIFPCTVCVHPKRLSKFKLELQEEERL